MALMNCVLLYMTAMLPSVLQADQAEYIPETSVSNGVISDKVRFGKLLIGSGSGNEMSFSETSPEVKKLRHLRSLVRCGEDSMTLRVPGPKAPHFLVDQGGGSPVPISELSASCGVAVRRIRKDVALIATYNGCHVQQQGGNYVLPLVIKGTPVNMSCPVSPPLPTVSCLTTAMTVFLETQAETIKLKVDGLWQPLLRLPSYCGFMLETEDDVLITAPFTGSCWETTDVERRLFLLYGDREVTVSCPLQPTTSSAPVSTDVIRAPPFPFPYGKPWWHPLTRPTVPPKPSVQQVPVFPGMYPMQMMNPYYQNQHLDGDFLHRPGWQSRFSFPYWYHYQNLFLPAATAAPTTSPPVQYPSYQWYQMLYGPQAVKYFPYNYFQASATTPAPTTTTASFHFQQFPQMLHGHQFSKTFPYYPSMHQYSMIPWVFSPWRKP